MSGVPHAIIIMKRARVGHGLTMLMLMMLMVWILVRRVRGMHLLPLALVDINSTLLRWRRMLHGLVVVPKIRSGYHFLFVQVMLRVLLLLLSI